VDDQRETAQKISLDHSVESRPLIAYARFRDDGIVEQQYAVSFLLRDRGFCNLKQRRSELAKISQIRQDLKNSVSQYGIGAESSEIIDRYFEAEHTHSSKVRLYNESRAHISALDATLSEEAADS
jgi:hypothetical protein